MPTENIALKPPSHTAIRQQVKLMLTTARFRNATNQADVLDFIVEGWISGALITEDTVGFAIFPKYVPDHSTDVRKTMGHLRKSLVRYYEQEGAEDLVRILLPESAGNKGVKLPPGEAYRPVALYNPRHPANIEFRVGETFGRRGDVSDLELAQGYYRRALDLYPDHVDAIISLGRTLSDVHRRETDPAASELLKRQIEMMIARAESLAPDYWRTHTLKALFYERNGMTARAKQAYKNAFASDADRTEKDFHYQLFLSRTGRLRDAITFAAKAADAEPNNADRAAYYGGFLVIDKQMDLGKKMLRYALRLDRNCVYARLYQAIICQVFEQEEELALHLKHLEVSLDGETFEKLLDKVMN